MEGFWHPHSSSVDFCEPNYLLSFYLAEPFNAFSSFYISWIGLVGLMHSNPTSEWPFTLLFLIAIFVGLGSFGLHATLHWLPQSFDEIPMLWFDVVTLYILCKIHDKEAKFVPDRLLSSFAVLAVAVTVVYYSLRHYYESFLVMYSVATAMVILWNSTLVWTLQPRDPLVIRIWAVSIFFYVCIAAVIWVIDMRMCDALLPYYLKANGLTFHVIWHVTAGLGAHIGVLQFTAYRAAVLKIPVHIEWIWTVPVVKETSQGKKIA